MARAGAVSPVPSCGHTGRSCRQFAKPCCGEWLASPLLRAICAIRSGSGRRSAGLRHHLGSARVPGTRPDGFAAVNAGSLGLEIAVYLPCWRLAELATARHSTIAAVIGELAGSAIVTAPDHAEDVVAGRYPDLAVARTAPDLLADPEAAGALGMPRIQADPPSWDDIDLGAITDIVQHAFGHVDLDRSLVE